jgi:hypothetical protein
MAKAPNTTTAPTGQIAPFGLRMLPEQREKIEEAARVSGRSMNAEIVARLQASFEDDKGLPEGVRMAVEDAAEDWGVSFEEALERAVIGGVSPNAPQVIMIRPKSGMTVEEMKQLFQVGSQCAHPGATVYFEK